MSKAKPVKSVIVLTAICLITAGLLATVNHFTSSIIKENEIKAENQALSEVLPLGDSFEEMPKDSDLDDKIEKVFKAENGEGYVFRVVSKGYGANLVILCGVSKDGKISGAKCMSSNETLGYEKTYGNMFAGKDKNTVSDVDIIAGATKTSEGYKQAVKAALEGFEILGEKLSKGGNLA